MIFLVKTLFGKVMSSGVDPRDMQCRDSDGSSSRRWPLTKNSLHQVKLEERCAYTVGQCSLSGVHSWLQHLMVLLGLVARLPQTSGRQSAETYLAPSVLAPAIAGGCPTKRSTMESFVIHSLVRKTFQVGSFSSCSHLPTWRLKVDCGP